MSPGFERAALQSRRKHNNCHAALAAEGVSNTCSDLPKGLPNRANLSRVGVILHSLTLAHR